jgi:hypothetical protein
VTKDKLEAILNEAYESAHAKATERFRNEWKEVDGGACGFAWVIILSYQNKKLDGRSKLGRMFKELDISQDHTRAFYIWNPGQMRVQCLDVLEAGAVEFARVLCEHGFEAYACSRLD